jgi:hypothetical protein
MVIRIRKNQSGKFMVTKLYFRAREVVLILPQQDS